MSNHPCASCGGTRAARYEDAPNAEAIGGEGCGVIVCSACSAIISVEDAADAAACREVEREGLHLRYDPDGMAEGWELGVKWSVRMRVIREPHAPNEHGAVGMGKSPSEALAAYREAAGR